MYRANEDTLGRFVYSQEIGGRGDSTQPIDIITVC